MRKRYTYFKKEDCGTIDEWTKEGLFDELVTTLTSDLNYWMEQDEDNKEIINKLRKENLKLRNILKDNGIKIPDNKNEDEELDRCIDRIEKLVSVLKEL